jgi:NitT/TauT family transport system permease protein
VTALPAARPASMRIARPVAAVLTFAAFVLCWKALVVVAGYPPFILPPPEQVAARFAGAWADGTIAPHAIRTLFEVALGFTVGASLAVLAGYVLARSPLVERLLSPYLVAAQATPILALSPLLALWFGPGLTAKIVICALIVFFPVAISTMVGVRAVDARLLELARSLRATRRQVVTTLEVPAALPAIFGGLRVGVTLAVVGAIVAEWAGGERGLGVLINLARGSLFDIPLMFATLVTIAMLGVALYLGVVLLERRLVPAMPTPGAPSL